MMRLETIAGTARLEVLARIAVDLAGITLPNIQAPLTHQNTENKESTDLKTHIFWDPPTKPPKKHPMSVVK